MSLLTAQPSAYVQASTRVLCQRLALALQTRYSQSGRPLRIAVVLAIARGASGLEIAPLLRTRAAPSTMARRVQAVANATLIVPKRHHHRCPVRRFVIDFKPVSRQESRCA